MKLLQAALSIHALLLPFVHALPASEQNVPQPAAQSRMDKITSMYGFEGFVYALDVRTFHITLREDGYYSRSP